MITFLQETTSTNDVARDPLYRHGDIVSAEFQTAGRGQRGHSWSSRRSENLMFSAVFEPCALRAAEQFLISEAVALALVDTLASYGLEARVKWTNDIYVGDKKIVGILIEHDLHGDCVSRTIAGIGLNVNQREFDPSLPNPTSMALETGRVFDRREVLCACRDALMRRMEQIGDGAGRSALQREYRSLLYRLGEEHDFRLPSGEVLRGTIRGAESTGELLVESGGRVRGYLFKEIEFIL